MKNSYQLRLCNFLYLNSLEDWQDFTGTIERPSAYKATYAISGTPKDVFFDMSDWNKGVVFINGFNLGRYWIKHAPVRTLYVPAPLLNEGLNTVRI